MRKVILVFCGMLALTPAASAYQSGELISLTASPFDNISVTGKVVDEQGNPLPGASVYVKGTTNGTISDIDGNFSLNVPSDAVLVFTFMGYTSQEINVNGRSNMGTITMREDNQEIEQVVVIGYGTQKKVDLTGSVAVVDADEMKKVSNSNISTMLEGKVAGVQITSDGQPGADPSVRIRGIGSFGSTAPLYVIDGVPMGTTIRDFSPNDIASIQVLKDASAAAIYGSRAANGVIIITTKQGKKEQPMKVDYSGYFGWDKISKNTYEVMNAQEYSNYLGQAAANSGTTLPSGYTKNDDGTYSFMDGTDTDWFDEVFKTGYRQNHNVNLSGGGKNNTYNIGLDYYDQKGTLEGAGPNYKRYTVRVNNTMDVKFIKFRTGIVYSHSDQDNMAISNASEYVQGLYGDVTNVLRGTLLAQPTIKAYDESTWILDDRVGAASAYQYDAYGYGVYYEDVHGDISFSNPLLVNNKLERTTKVDRFAVTASATVDLFDMFNQKFANHKLNYNINLAYNKTYCKYHTWIGAWVQSNRVYLAKENERLTEQFTHYNDALVENTINYEGTFADKHHLNIVVGQTYENEYYDQLTGQGVNFPEPYFLQVNNGETKLANTSDWQHVLASYIGRLTYDYDGKYLLQATVRRDGSSRLSSADRWGWFPSVSLGWRIDKEAFFPVDENLINLLKIRGSYGILGNENIGDYQYMTTMNRRNMTYSFNGTAVAGSAISTFVNTGIAWEKKKSTNIGLDLGMFNGQLDFTFEWYKNVSDDLLASVAVPASTGVSNGDVTMNAASMENTGFEWSANYHNYKHKIKYDISFNISTLKNEVTSLGTGKNQRIDGAYITRVGEEIGQFFGWEYGGIIRSQADLDQLNAYAAEKGASEYQAGANIGDCWYVDQNEDGKIDTDDQTILGSGLPKINFGLSGRVEWNGWDLSVSTFGALKYKVSDDIYNSLHGSYGWANKSVDLNSANQFDADGNYISDVPRTYVTNNASLGWNDLFSKRMIQNANYWKIATVELGYNFKDAWFNGILTNVRAYVTGQNLATLTKYKGYNVDYAGGTFTPGYNFCSYPTPKTVMVGLKATF
ncbi:MAG: TonB-dependent receptor [Bacteroidales bacterium]|nr:TonB-dependent receptor [Bacteroidales bacterium]